jgi:hypothetical protein
VWVAGRRLSFGMGILAGGAIVNLVHGAWLAVGVEAVLGCVLLLGCVNYVTVGPRITSRNTSYDVIRGEATRNPADPDDHRGQDHGPTAR